MSKADIQRLDESEALAVILKEVANGKAETDARLQALEKEIDDKQALKNFRCLCCQNPIAKSRRLCCQNFPEDLILEILLRLPAKSVARFRCVSKTWLSIGTDSSFLRAHSHRAPKSFLRQPAIIGLDFHRFNVASFPVCNFNRVYSVPELFTAAEGFSAGGIAATRKMLSLPEELHSNCVKPLASCDGLVFLHTCNQCYYVLNPLTGQCTSLPRPRLELARKSFGFYFHRWTGVYRLISIDAVPSTNSSTCEMLSLGTESWRIVEGFRILKFVSLRQSPVRVDDFLYWSFLKVGRSVPNEILVFDIRAELFTTMPSPPYMEEWKLMIHEKSRSLDMGLVDIEAKLGFYIVGIDEKGIRIDVWLMEDYAVKRWTKFYSDSYSHRLCLAVESLNIDLYAKDGELLLVIDVPRERFLVRCNMKSGKYCVDQVYTDALLIGYPTIIYKESLISYENRPRTERLNTKEQGSDGDQLIG